MLDCNWDTAVVSTRRGVTPLQDEREGDGTVNRPLSDDHWPQHALLVRDVGAQLQIQNPIPTKVLDQAIQSAIRTQMPQITNPSFYSQPTDYCYNTINQGLFSFEHPVFVKVRRGYFEYVGDGYPFSGDICWKSKRVGVFDNGCYSLFEDPRSSFDDSRWHPALCSSPNCPASCRKCVSS